MKTASDKNRTKSGNHDSFNVPPSNNGEEEPEQTEIDPEDDAAMAAVWAEEDEEPTSPFPVEALPPAIKAPVEDWMRQLGMPALFPAVCALTAISAALGRGVRVRNNKGQTYPNIFSLLGADSGVGKSLAYNEAMRPLEELQAECDEAFRLEKSELQAGLSLLKKEITKALKDGKPIETNLPGLEKSTRKNLTELYEEKDLLETRMASTPCVWTSDFTSEALGARLAASNEQLAVLSDEGGICLNNLLGKYNKSDMTDDILLCKCFSVNAHAVDRIGRGRLTLKLPCITLLLLVQPDLLTKAFQNERLLLGGFLARCLCADTQLEMQEEKEGEESITFDAKIVASWSKLIKTLYAKYHEAKTPYDLTITPEVWVLSQLLHNSIVQKVRGQFFDIKSFAARWREITWKVALVLHAALYGTNCEKHLLEASTFKAATQIVKYFNALQIKVLENIRSDRLKKTHARLQELFLINCFGPITLRDLTHRHKIPKGEVLLCVKNYSGIYKMTSFRPKQGGRLSTVISLQNVPK
jgi:replicative DNA helicase